MDLREQFRNTIRLSAALEEIIVLVEDRSDDLTMDELMEKLNEIIEDYKLCSLTDYELRLLEEEEQ